MFDEAAAAAAAERLDFECEEATAAAAQAEVRKSRANAQVKGAIAQELEGGEKRKKAAMTLDAGGLHCCAAASPPGAGTALELQLRLSVCGCSTTRVAALIQLGSAVGLPTRAPLSSQVELRPRVQSSYH